LPAVRAVAAARGVAGQEYRAASGRAAAQYTHYSDSGAASSYAALGARGGDRVCLHIFYQGVIAHGAAAQCDAENFDTGAGQTVRAAD
jgi:hypothetical protein